MVSHRGGRGQCSVVATVTVVNVCLVVGRLTPLNHATPVTKKTYPDGLIEFEGCT